MDMILKIVKIQRNVEQNEQILLPFDKFSSAVVCWKIGLFDKMLADVYYFRISLADFVAAKLKPPKDAEYIIALVII